MQIMQDSPLIISFQRLSKAERQALRKWVNSPFFNQRADVVRLFEYLCTHVPVDKPAPQNSGELEKIRVFAHVFSTEGRRSAKGYSDADMRYAMSFLYQAVKQFLAYAHWAEDETDTALHLCKSLRTRGLDRLFEKESAVLSDKLARKAHQSVDFFYRQYQLQLEHWELFRRANRGTAEALRTAGAARDAFIAAETLREAAALRAAPGASAESEHSIFLQATLDALKAGHFADKPAVVAYFHCYQMLTTDEAPSETHFQALYRILTEHWALFPANESRDLFVMAINYCIRRLNRGAKAYIRSALDLYRSGLELRILLEDGQLNKYTYNNVLLLALALEEWDWAFHFLEEYRALLPLRDRNSVWRYNLATYYFRKKEYRQAQEILSQVEFKDVFYNLEARRMLVRIFFDTEEFAALDSLLDSFSVYLQRKRTTLGYHKELNLNFIRFVKQILRLEPGDSEGLARLREKIQKAPSVAEREWLLQKC